MNIVIRHNDVGQWWWTALDVHGETVAVSVLHGTRADCVRAIAEMKVEGPPAQVTDDGGYAARPGTWTISSLIPSGS
ncbi:MAG: hypothetical protein ACRDNB_12145 [Gaiellaceae bacterium]